ncbi:hypothetical protein SARC_03265 [Sphaeroforma arctica JP610]|uniref:GtrA/DPMS transmembrane domain-containing protein n=1 Tax=Sphaeroforma arctica JP610 TaxID=667725 RepID=A0A0L0G6D8_9EUKA|nr:hypothetical protein SARC_03265 [Sphaeroforma arctica JP610]KNC84519.1 hypothetical protein SARC_03265 [Sphaeroforma arctica JP610]|eukprot:XP_014158421.1 hypothetical protein SARC_03265 [Sphaeroforma arctica JP610]
MSDLKPLTNRKNIPEESSGAYKPLSLIPEVGRFALSGGIGNTIFFKLNQYLFQDVGISGSISWTLAYLLSIPLQQILHRHIVYLGVKNGTSSYFVELFRLYVSYSMSIVVGLLLSYVMEQLGVDHDVAWGVNVIATGIVSYVMVNRAMGKQTTD